MREHEIACRRLCLATDRPEWLKDRNWEPRQLAAVADSHPSLPCPQSVQAVILTDSSKGTFEQWRHLPSRANPKPNGPFAPEQPPTLDREATRLQKKLPRLVPIGTVRTTKGCFSYRLFDELNASISPTLLWQYSNEPRLETIRHACSYQGVPQSIA